MAKSPGFNHSLPNATDYIPPNIVEQMDIKPGWLSLTVLMMIACLVTNFLLIFIIVSRKHFRRQPSKWLLLNMTVCILVKGVLLVSREHLSKTGLPDWSNITSLCVPLDILHTLKVYMVPIATLLVTIERLVCLLKPTNEHSGFGPRVTIAMMVSGWLIALVYTLLSILVVGQLRYVEHNGRRMCHINFSEASIYMFLVTFNLISICVLGLTIAIICLYFCRATTPYKTFNVVMAITVPNAIYISLKISTYGLYLLYYSLRVGREALIVMFNVYFIYIFLVPIGWLAASRELRTEVKRSLCPWCPAPDHETDEHIILDEDQNSVSNYNMSTSAQT